MHCGKQALQRTEQLHINKTGTSFCCVKQKVRYYFNRIGCQIEARTGKKFLLILYFQPAWLNQRQQHWLPLSARNEGKVGTVSQPKLAPPRASDAPVPSSTTIYGMRFFSCNFCLSACRHSFSVRSNLLLLICIICFCYPLNPVYQ